jgi:hypothetical protein
LAARNLERGMSLVPQEKKKVGSMQRFMFFFFLDGKRVIGVVAKIVHGL